jgi:signal transduction histidine kinase
VKMAGLRIVIVEDDPAHAEAISRSFETAPTKAFIQVAGTLREYRQLVASSPPDIVLMDLNMPDGRAIDMLVSPKESAPFPILIMTSYGNEQTVVEALKSGALDYVVKSQEAFAAMPNIVERALREWGLLQKHKQMEEALRTSERKRAEDKIESLNADLLKRNEELEFANKELESFIYSVSHDLRAPLRAISGFSEILMKDIADKLNEKEKRNLSRILDGTKKMSRLIDDLLNLSSISRKEVHRREVNLSAIAASIISELRETDPGSNVKVDIKEGLTAFADPGLIEIVLSNLLGNSWKFTAKNGHARIEFGTVEQDGKIIYYVRDNGAGFDQQHAGNMFRPFHRLHSEAAFEGTGIGLAIVDRIISRHGGKVWAEGIEGKGATIYFSLT